MIIAASGTLQTGVKRRWIRNRAEMAGEWSWGRGAGRCTAVVAAGKLPPVIERRWRCDSWRNERNKNTG